MTRRLFLATLIAQTAIVVTGGAVRLTGSGLGCPTWPECAEGSYTPTPMQSEGVHKWIEFGNRLLTFALAIIILAAIGAAIRQLRKGHPHGRTMVALAVAQFLGIFAQAILGGITVLTDLHPIPVAGHFLLSMILIAIATTLYFIASGPSTHAPREVRTISIALTVLAAFVVILGTIVTGSGPHAGDEKARRFGFDPRVVSWLHADFVIAFVVGLLALWIIVRITGRGGVGSDSGTLTWSGSGARLVGRNVVALLGISTAQGAIGYIQYFTGLPAILVGVHLLGACLVWVFSWRLFLASWPRLIAFSPLR